MKVVICERPGSLVLNDQPMPEGGSNDVLIRVKRVGVCGTDLHIFTGNQPFLNYPRVMGHELSGIVETAPAGATVRPGDQVYVMPYLACGTCIACRGGKPNCCVNIRVLGVHADGGMAEYLAVPQEFVFAAEGVTLDQAAMIEFRQLRYLIAAAEAGSFSRAARRLGIKQATLSRHILDTEKRLKIVLFDRKTRGASLTPDGETYLRKVQYIMKNLDELDEWVRTTRNGETGRLSVGFYTSFSAGNLRATVSEFTNRHPDVKIRGFERGRDLLLAGIESQLLDIAIIAGETAYPALASRPFWSERLLAVLPEDHVLAARERIYWPDLARECFLLMERDPGPETRSIILSKLGMPGFSPHIDMDDITRETALSSIALGGHISIVAETAIGLQIPGVVFRELFETNGHTRIGYSGYWREDNENPVLRRFLDFVVSRYSLPPIPHRQRETQQAKEERP